MGIAPLNIDCPHCAVSTHVAGEHTIRCRCCEELWQVRLHSDSVGFQELRVEWFDGLEVRSKPVYHHITTPRPKPEPETSLERYECLACGMPHHSETDFFECTNCRNWSHKPFHPQPPKPPAPRLVKDGEPTGSRVGRYPEGDMTLPGYDLTAWRRQNAARNRRWLGVALLMSMLIGRFVTAHDFDRFAETALALTLGWIIGVLFFPPDER